VQQMIMKPVKAITHNYNIKGGTMSTMGMVLSAALCFISFHLGHIYGAYKNN